MPVAATLRFRPREQQVIDLLITGDSQKEIASRLGISPKSVATYIALAKQRTGARSTEQLIAMAVEAFRATS